MLRLVVLFCLASGAILAAAQGSLAVSDLSLLSQLTSHLVKGDILLGDRGFGCHPLIAWLQQTCGVDFIGRTTRRSDGRRRRRRLGANDANPERLNARKTATRAWSAHAANFAII